VSNGASIVLEQAAARPEASVFLRPSVMADVDEDDEDDTTGCCFDADFEDDVVVTFVTFTLAHPPPPLGTCTKFDDDDAAVGSGMMENFANEICTERKKR